MPKRPIAIAAAAALTATLVLAHDGVKDPDVAKRMHAMSDAGKSIKELAAMASGKAPLHQAKARMARDGLALTATRIPTLFESAATDPKSEALPAIWDNWEDFTARATAMQQAANALDFTDRAALSAGMPNLGATCSGCHKSYRLKK